MRKPIDPLTPLLPSLPHIWSTLQADRISPLKLLRHYEVVYLFEVKAFHRDYSIVPCLAYNHSGVRVNVVDNYGRWLFDKELIRSQRPCNTIEEAIEAGKKLVDRLYEQPKF